MSLPPPPNSPFPATHWSLVKRLRSADAVVARRAMEDIFNTYRYPLYGFLRGSQMHHEDAEDVLQGFFEKMLRTDSLGDADSARGKLRTFLLTALARFKSNWQRGEHRRHQRVRGEADLPGENEARWQQEQHSTQETPDLVFERRWAAELIAQVRARLRADYEQRGKLDLHNTLLPFLISEGPDTLVATATRLGMNENALRIALTRMRQDFRHLLLEEVKQTLDEGEDARAEIRHLLGLFERK
jgi:DNA-directed RNA polymerase specialized sigma24 family protein